jgi:hypothetical protein
MKYAQRNNVVTWVIGDGNGFVDEFCGGGAGDTGDSNYSVEVMLAGVSRMSLVRTVVEFIPCPIAFGTRWSLIYRGSLAKAPGEYNVLWLHNVLCRCCISSQLLNYARVGSRGGEQYVSPSKLFGTLLSTLAR